MTDYNAHESLRSSKEQAILDAHAERRAAKEREESLRKERLAERFWRRVYWSCMVVLGIIIAWTVLKIFL